MVAIDFHSIFFSPYSVAYQQLEVMMTEFDFWVNYHFKTVISVLTFTSRSTPWDFTEKQKRSVSKVSTAIQKKNICEIKKIFWLNNLLKHNNNLWNRWWSQSVLCGMIEGHDGQRVMGKYGQDAGVTPLLFFRRNSRDSGIFNDPQRVRTSGLTSSSKGCQTSVQFQLRF